MDYPPPGAPDPGAPPDPNATPPGYSDPSSGWLPPGWEGGPSGYGPPGGTLPPDSLPPGYGSPGEPGGGQGPWGGGSGQSSAYGGPYGPPAPRGPRRASPLAIVVGAVLVAALIAIPVVILTSSGAASQATSLYTRSMQLAGDSVGFHYVSSWTGGGEPTTTYAGDAGQKDGTQVIIEPTEYGSEQYQELLATDQTLYFEGNAPALEDELGVAASAASGLAGTWVSLQPADAPYSDAEVGLTVASDVGVTGFVATSTAQVTGAGGAKLTRIKGTVAATSGVPSATVQVDISPSSNLPVSIVITYSDGTVNTMTFTEWGTAPAVSVPATPVAWSTLTTSSPPDGYGSGETPTASPTPTPTPAAVGAA